MKLKIAEDFSYAPGPRFVHEGEYSGELFRKTLLLPAMKEAISKNETLTVDLDGTAGFGRSFLEESFGGLIRIDKLDYKSILDHLEIISNEERYLKDKVYFHLEKAHNEERVVA
ncbi:MAG TPA: STAS-like domain-containing protein [Pyrinomonadaceae bacterium]|nr:STAS-like domain-containing protein [Pyrinomonadaceae bacterium]